MNVTAIVPAAGLGRRAGGDVPKQFLLLRGMPILTRTLLNLTNSGLVNALVLVVPPGAEEWCQQHILAPYPLPPSSSTMVAGTSGRPSMSV